MIHALAGFLAGLVHVLSGPDHLAALAPLAAAGQRRGWRIGAVWGAGHTGGVWLVALLALLLRGILPIDALSAWSERLVGIVLIGLGLWGLRLAFGDRLHTHEHRHDGTAHMHMHAHRNSRAQGRHVHSHTAFGVGVLHGLAGSAHFLGVLPALALGSNGAALSYVAGFGGGTVVAMAIYANCIAALAARFSRGPLHAYRVLLASCAGAACVVGCIWLLI